FELTISEQLQRARVPSCRINRRQTLPVKFHSKERLERHRVGLHPTHRCAAIDAGETVEHSAALAKVAHCGEQLNWFEASGPPLMAKNSAGGSLENSGIGPQKLKEEREARRHRLDERHHHLLAQVADFYCIEKSEVEDGILDGNNVDQMELFFAAGGTCKILVHYQEPDLDKEGPDQIRIGQPGSKSTRAQKPRIFVSDGSSAPIRGPCAVFMRPDSQQAVTEANISRDVTFFSIDGSDGILRGVEQVLSTVLVPQLRELQGSGWGQLECQEHAREQFLNGLENFVNMLNTAQETINDRVVLKPCTGFDLKRLKTITDINQAASQADSLAAVEECAASWMKQIEQVLAETEQIRREADNVGPRAELDYWKRRMAKFNYLLDQLKSNDVKQVLGVLNAAKSKSLKTWFEMDRRITDNANEAKDNVKFLYTLDEHCMPLYHSDPVKMVDMIPKLINGIRMIHSISRYYNTSERMTSLFVKVTNQMITACKSYISQGGSETIWSQPTADVISQLKDCIRLNEEYQACFQRTKQKLEQMPGEKRFEFSEMYIFGKFDTFCRRLKKIIEMFQTMELFAHLSDSKIEGMEMMAAKFNVIVVGLKKKPYDFLDQRRTDFDNDFEDFKRQIQELQGSIQGFMDSRFEKLTSSQRAIQTLKRFERLKIPRLGIDEKYQKILAFYGKELEAAVRIYNKNKDDPPIARDLPPIGGKICWARQLFRRIEEPMVLFKKMPHLLQSADGKKLVKNYNKLAEALVAFEMLYHRAWIKQLQTAQDGLKASLLVRHPESKRLFVNLDPEILTLIRETELMVRLGMDVPLAAQHLRARQATIKRHYDELNSLLEDYSRVLSTVPQEYEPLMGPRLGRLRRALEPGLTSLNWMSLATDSYIRDVRADMCELELLLARAKDLREFRIDRVLEEMANVRLCELPDSEPWTIDSFVERTQSLCQKGAQLLQVKSVNVEEAVNELINMLVGEELDDDDRSEMGAEESEERQREVESAGERPAQLGGRRKKDEKEQIEEAAMELLNHFNHRNMDAIVKVTKNTLEALRKRISASTLISYDKAANTQRPFFRCFATLSIPQVAMHPTTEEVQQCVNKSCYCIISVSKGVSQWSKERKTTREKFSYDEEDFDFDGEVTTARSDARRPSIAASVAHTDISGQSDGATSRAGFRSHRGRTESEEGTSQYAVQMQANNYFKSVSENKEVAKLASLLSAAINSQKKAVQSAMERFYIYRYIWEQNREEALQEFVQQSPRLGEYEAKILDFEQKEETINAEPPSYDCGPIAIFTERLKLGLLTETKAWRLMFGRSCNLKYKSEMEDFFAFMDDIEKKLSRPIKDLDDIRIAMAALKDIRENEIRIDMGISPIEESYAMLFKHDLPVPKEEAERVDTLRYTWEKLRAHGIEVQNHLVTIQTDFRDNLVHEVVVFKQDCADFYSDYGGSGPMVPGVPPREASDRLVIFQNRFDNLHRKFITYTGGEELFGLPVSEYPELHKIKKELNLLTKLYSLYNDVINTVNGYYDILFTEVDIEKISGELQEFQNRCRKLPKALKDWPAFADLSKTIDDFNEMVPLLELMTNKAMKPRHWQRMSDLTKHNFEVESDGFTLRNILEAPLLKHKEEIEDICISAGKEKDIEAKLKNVIAEWNSHEFKFGTFKNRGELLLRGDHTGEIISFMEDSLMVLSSLLSNRYNAPFKKLIQQWVSNLSNSSEIIEQWMTVQNLWVYLEAVFVGGDIAKQLPKEAKRFSNIDKSWIKIMTRAHETTNVIQCCVGDETLAQLLPHLLEQLELCQKSLTGYLEKKRLLFPRFFFVSDPALLEILGQASDPHTIQAHLLSVFDNIKTVKFHEKQYETITTCYSSEGEQLELEKPVRAEGNVEVWLMTLMQQSQRSLHGVIRTAYMAISDQNFQILEFLDMFPAQIGLLGIQLIWTRDSTEALNIAKSDKKAMTSTNQGFLDLLNLLIQQTTRELSKVERTKFETLITIHVHQRDIFDDLCKLHVKSPTDFEWLKQTRFYFVEDTDKCLISITDVDFEYQNEFLGCTERLVITPLTDRCYITLSQALGMSMGGAPAGPAGTGKTETTKDMGRCLGKYVVVFNCSDQMDFRGLGRIYKGLAQSGSWGCFDEFNRIELPVLSVAAQQIAIVLTCKKERKKQFVFTDGDLVEMNPEFGLFLTMNPGYAGRQELPENLKINFRTVAMMVPDRQIIIRVKLASVGFIDNVVLARKFFTLYKLCEEQLTKQVHYDFGLRNILSVLRTLGAVKRSNPNDTEQTTVMRVLRDMNLSKLVDQDEPLFLSLINDLFPGIQLDKAGYPQLEAAISQQVQSAELINWDSWNLKLIQLFETQRVRHGMMTLGPSGAGKTCCIHTLMKAMTDCGEPHRELRMNPKAITAPQMFGRLDVATNDWTDGIFSTLWRRTLKAKKGEHIWLVLDGPVDAIWIENLNSVLDDNKTLTLANGDRIPMAPNCKIIFEVHNIDNASPATVSRNGMVYMSSSGLNWNPLLSGWLLKRPAFERDHLFPLFEDSFPDILLFATQFLTFKMSVLEAFIVRQCCDLLEGLIPRREEKEGAMKPEFYRRLYVFVIMWSIGALLEWEDRNKLEQHMRSLKLDLPVYPADSDNTMFDFLVSETGTWQHWEEKVEEFTYPTDSTPEYGSILVPNVDNVRTEFLIHTIHKQEKQVLLIGEQGTAKTVMINKFLARFNPEEHMNKALNFSSATTPMMFQRTIESYVDKRMGSTFGPPAGRKMTVFIDDINMPIINEWGDQIANEIVRQLMENSGFYNLEKPGDFTTLVDMQFMAAMIHPGGGRNDIPQRLKRQFNIFNCTLPSNPSIDKIFSVIGCGHYCQERGFSDEVRALIARLVPLTRRLWQLTKIKMLPTPAKFHYVFNLRDLSRIWQGMINTVSDVVKDVATVFSLWKHECCRVISDRFTTYDDVNWFTRTMSRVVVEDMGEEVGKLVEPTHYFIPTFDFLAERLRYFMGQYNENIRGAGMDLVFFQDAMTHLVKISRIISTPRGNALLVGVGGSGKQSLTRLASFIAGYNTFQITLTRSYNVVNLMEDLKFLYRTAGQQGKGITFVFTDNEIKDESFLEYLNNVLASGVVSNLFPRDEMDEICQELISVMKKEFPRRPPTNENLQEYFLSRTRQNLHVVLCFSPVGEKFRSRALKFPALISGCTMDWFQRWPRDALVAVADHFLSRFPLVCSDTVKQDLIQTMGVVHDGVAESCAEYFNRYRRSTHVTPKSYLSFLQGYKKIYEEKLEFFQGLAGRMDSGLEKLLEAQESAAKPALEAAEEALNTIKPADIATVRKLGKPPHLIMRIMDCVLILFQRRLDLVAPDPERPCVKPSWSESLKLMSNTGFLSMLTQFAKDSMNEESIEFLMPYIDMEDYNLETAKRVCGNVAGLLSWTKAMQEFFWINKEVMPLKDNLAKQEVRLKKANDDLAAAQATLDEKEAELAKVRAVYEEAMRKKQALEDDAAACRRKMSAAEQLITGLADEKERWTRQSKEYKSQIGRLVGDVLMATAFLSYSGPFNQDFRLLLNRNWQKNMKDKKIPYSENLNLIEMLVEATTIAEWNLQGLPNDELSTENGIIVTQASRYPLLIDPQGQGKIWIKNREAVRELQITSLNHKYFRQHLEDALSLGRPLLIEDINEELDPALDNVLEKNFIKQGSTLKVKVGDKEVDVLKGFSLYVTTKLPNPAYTPELYARTSIIDFTVTMKGLEDQLLGRVIKTEKSELEEQRVQLMEDVTNNNKIMKNLEDTLLFRLTSTQGSLVDDEELIGVLKETKVTSADVKQKIETAKDTQIKIASAREEYRPVASRGSILYFLITEMSMVNVMYQTSLRQFLGLFDLSMERSSKSPITTKRITNIIDYMTFEVWKYAVRGLYEEDKMTFTLLLTLKIDMHGKKVKHEEFQTLIKGGASLDLNVVQPKPHKWILDSTWLNLVELSNLHQFSGILDQITRSEKAWKQWFDKEAPEEEIIPDGYNTNLDAFRRLLLIRSWCPDRTISQAKRYIADSLGEKFAEGVILDVEAVWEESEPRTPMVGLLSMGSDPTTSIELLAKKHKKECKAISMGQGQEIHARRLMSNSLQNGGWVLLQNCHLSLDYLMEVMDQLVEAETVHEDFSLWVTCEVHPKFPISFLQQSIKFTNEPPQGVKAGLKRTFTSFTQDFLDISNMPQWRPMLYGVAFLHTVVQERRKFGPIGWNIPYEFNTADLNASIQFVQNHLDDMDLKKGVNWNTVRYMLSEIQYGGRVTDDYDKVLLNTFCKVWFSEKMFEPTFEFYKGYSIPKFARLNEYIEYIQNLPGYDTPQVFGLHANADISYQGRTTKTILDCILSIQPKDSGGGSGETRESVVYKQAEDLLEKLPGDYVPFEVRERLQKMGPLQPMNIFLRQEVDRMQRVISAVRTTLTDLKLAIDGTIIMNENLRDALDSMYDAKIPQVWSKISWDSSALGFWFTELINRNQQFHTWVFGGRPNCFWMTGFFNPQGFLTAMRQEVTRAHKGWALDSVLLHNDVTKMLLADVHSPPTEGVYVHGLFLEGAGWDRRNNRLTEARAKILNEQLPVVHIYAINGPTKDEKLYVCPIYKKPRRTDLTYVAAIKLRTSQPADHWVIRGVALLCDVM
uniref:Dynein heavy chain 5, axonemal n=1 Tax=Macrostomum lignano TaxID=282301 RepID=A0A1I8FY30_9PLAT